VKESESSTTSTGCRWWAAIAASASSAASRMSASGRCRSRPSRVRVTSRPIWPPSAHGPGVLDAAEVDLDHLDELELADRRPARRRLGPELYRSQGDEAAIADKTCRVDPVLGHGLRRQRHERRHVPGIANHAAARHREARVSPRERGIHGVIELRFARGRHEKRGYQHARSRAPRPSANNNGRPAFGSFAVPAIASPIQEHLVIRTPRQRNRARRR
jgi:hypothetical protein